MPVPCKRTRRAAAAGPVAVLVAAVWLAMVAPCAAQPGGPARAQPSLLLTTRSCPGDWAGGLQRFVRIELGAEPADPAPDGLRIHVHCDGDMVDIEVAQRGDALGTRRRMDLSATAASVRARVVALAIAGLARELALMAQQPLARKPEPEAIPSSEPKPEQAPEPNSEPEPEREPEPEPPPAPDTAPPDEPEHEPPHAMQVDLLLSASRFTAADPMIWGAGARLDLLGFAPYRLGFGLQAGTYAHESALGSSRLIAGSVSARLGVTIGDRTLALTPGVGQQLGVARASGSADDSETAHAFALTAPWTASFAFVTFEAAAWGPWILGVDGELGVVLLPVHGRVERGDDVDVDGAWLALSAVLGLRL